MATGLAPRPARRPRHFALAAAVGITSVPFLAAAARRIANGWQPASDDAAIARIAHDVFTRHSPLLGMPSTIYPGVKPLPHHWGPMLFWYLSIPDRVFGSSPAGLLIAVAALNIASLAGIAVFVNRRLGAGAAAWMLAVLGLVVFSLGQEVISSVWNPDVAVLPLALLVVLAWSVAGGDTVALPFMVAAGSFVVQAHLLYTVVVLALVVWAVLGLAASRLVRDRGRFSYRHRAAIPHLRRHAVTAVVVAAVCWSTALYQQATGHPGNMSRVLDASSASRSKTAGLWPALHVLTHTLAVPPLWAVRHSLSGYHGLYGSPSLLEDAVALVVLLAPCAAVFWLRGDRQARTLVITLLVLVVASLFTVAQLPLDLFVINPYRVRFVWLTGAFAWFVLGAIAVRSVRLPRAGPVRAAVAAGVVFVLGFGAIAGSLSHARGWQDLVTDPQNGTISSLSRQLQGQLSHQEPYLLRGTAYLDSVGTGVMWDLVRHDFDIRGARKDPYIGQAHGPPPGHRISTLLVIDHASARPGPGQRLIASTRPSAATRVRLARQAARLCAALQRDPPTLTRTGQALLKTGAHPLVVYRDRIVPIDYFLLVALVEQNLSCGLVQNGSLPVLLHIGAIKTRSLTEAEVVAFQDSRDLADLTTFDVYLRAR